MVYDQAKVHRFALGAFLLTMAPSPGFASSLKLVATTQMFQGLTSG
jgi:hypothetical protein